MLHLHGRGDVHRRRKSIVGRLRHVDVIVGMHRNLAAQRHAHQLRASVGDDLVHVHVELRAAPGHPHMQRKHILMLPRNNLIADLYDQSVRLVAQTLAGMVRIGRGFFQNGVRRDHLARHQVPPMLK